jgi:hypothetical protein
MSGSRLSARRSSETIPNRITATTNMDTVTGREIAPRI